MIETGLKFCALCLIKENVHFERKTSKTCQVLFLMVIIYSNTRAPLMQKKDNVETSGCTKCLKIHFFIHENSNIIRIDQNILLANIEI